MFAKVDKTKTAFAVEFQKAIAQQPTWLATLATRQSGDVALTRKAGLRDVCLGHARVDQVLNYRGPFHAANGKRICVTNASGFAIDLLNTIAL